MMSSRLGSGVAHVAGPCLLLVSAAGAAAQTTVVFPTLSHAAFNFIPFGSAPGPNVQHQVFASTLFSNASGGQPVTIQKIAFAPNSTLANTLQTVGDLTVRLGYTARTPGLAPPAGLDIPDLGGGGIPNASGPMTVFFSQANYSYFVTAGGPNNFEMELVGTPFVYDPNQGNLLVEIHIGANTSNTTLSVSRAAGSAESSRAYATGRFGSAASPTTATRMQFTFVIGGGPACYANCDGSTTVPFLNVADFTCFLQRFAAGDPYANCDGSTTPPVLNVADFTCFLQAFAAGCSAP